MSGARSGRWWRSAPALVVAWCAAAPARAQDDAPAATSAQLPCLSAAASEQDDPTRLLDLALSCYEAEEYDASLALLERLSAIDPNPVVSFNLGAVHAALGHCTEARHHYELYIERTQSEAGKADARQQLETLGDCGHAPNGAQPALSTAAAPPAPEAPASSAQPPVMVLRTPQPVPEGSPYGGLETAAPEPPSRLASWILLGSGAALALASGGFAYASQQEERAEGNSDRSTGDAVADAQADGRRYNTLAWACAGGALALATSGLLLIAFEPSADVTGAAQKPLQGAWSLRVSHEF